VKFLLVAIITVASVLVVPTIEASQRGVAADDTYGIVVLSTVEAPAGDPMPDDASLRYEELQRLAESYPDDLARPWFDPTTGQLVIDTVTDKGHAVASTALAAKASGFVATSERRVKFSLSALDKVRHQAIDLTSNDVYDGDAIFMSALNKPLNKVVLSVSRLSPELLKGLAARFGSEILAVREIPGVVAQGTGRDNDTSPFFGGAKILADSVCSDAFSWYSGSTQMMLTAGHCVPDGGSVSTPPSYYMGSVSPNTRENWSRSTGTVYLTGQSTYRGDIALIEMPSYRSGGAVIYRGPAGSGSPTATVGEMWSRRAEYNDNYCVSGITSGETCNWTVAETYVDFKWDSGQIVRNAIASSWKGNPCTEPGDSGGSVYTVRADGKVAAKGINSSKASNPLLGCMDIFTDIYEAYYGLPGYLTTA
jgi:hypothetical protein